MAKKRSVRVSNPSSPISFRCGIEYREWLEGLKVRKKVSSYAALFEMALAESAEIPVKGKLPYPDPPKRTPKRAPKRAPKSRR